MPEGIIIFGANGSGKSTIGRAVAQALNYKHMDIEEYHFIPSQIPYTVARSREDCLNLLFTDIVKYRSFVITAVTGDFGEKISSMYRLAVQISAPKDIRIDRIRQRAYEQFGERVCEGGDMYEQNLKFIDFAASRSLSGIEQWAETLHCPVVHVDGTKPICKNVKRITEQYLTILSDKRQK